MSAASGLRARLFVWLQYVLPQHAVSRVVLAATRVRTPWLKNLLIRSFLRMFPVDMAEAAECDPYRHGSFNEFFTRALKPGARPVADGTARIACPVDGCVSECGHIEGGSLLQAKGRRFTLEELLAGQTWARRFEGGSFATIYLAPFNYHRIHMPADGRLLDTVYVPGRLFSVNDVTAQRVPRLFAGRRLERREYRHGLGGRHHPRFAAQAHACPIAADLARQGRRARPVQHGVDGDSPVRARARALEG
jgi:phosphatidylserine decarboxylase